MTIQEAIKIIKSGLCRDCGIFLGGGKCSKNCYVIEAIKALEQMDVLDKIRAEIERGKTGLDIEFNGGIDYALNIIDKYKEEIEPQEIEKYCDRNICVLNDYNGIGCNECEVTKSQELRKSEE